MGDKKKLFHVETQTGDGMSLPIDSHTIEQLICLAFDTANQDIDLPLGITIRVVGNTEGRLLNKKFAKKNKSTNVLSFIGNASEERKLGIDPPFLGDIIICLPVVETEAKEQGKNFIDHLYHMIIHGFLHLIGLDHKNDQEESIMTSIEKKVLASSVLKKCNE
ncbi:MAG: rRNA maturation RNase YbeY [Gammaproteobacteria bacterium]|jgi:rRNA maturation RNase YbeY|nr:rRNA maturation RNase YbeY [Gammaproteobacteria bacterium]MDG2435175.1 rRNA maturation RNase YbeY [Gammaproteobacteria bacterium]